jgi:hypothetical protein
MDEAMAHAPAAEVVREIIDDTNELVRLEIALAKKASVAEIARARSAAIAAAVGFAAATSGLTMVCVAVVFATRAPTTVAGALAIALLCVAAALGIVALRLVPRPFFAETRKRVEEDVRLVTGAVHARVSGIPPR